MSENMKKIAVKRRKGAYFEIELQYIETMEKIVKKTGETKLDLFKRLLLSESKRIEEGLSMSETINSNLVLLLEHKKETTAALSSVAEDSKVIRDGVNKIFSITIFLMRELYRLTHFFANVFIRSSLITPGSKFQGIIEESNAEAAQSFNNFYSTIMNLPSKGIVELLKKN
jgi:hypothetical protein